MEAALNLQEGFALLLAHGHGYDQILSWTWDQVAFAIQGILEVESDRLDTLVRVLAPLAGGKVRDRTTLREARRRTVIEDDRAVRAAKDRILQAAIIDEAMANLAAMGFEVEDVEATGESARKKPPR